MKRVFHEKLSLLCRFYSLMKVLGILNVQLVDILWTKQNADILWRSIKWPLRQNGTSNFQWSFKLKSKQTGCRHTLQAFVTSFLSCLNMYNLHFRICKIEEQSCGRWKDLIDTQRVRIRMLTVNNVADTWHVILPETELITLRSFSYRLQYVW